MLSLVFFVLPRLELKIFRFFLFQNRKKKKKKNDPKEKKFLFLHFRLLFIELVFILQSLSNEIESKTLNFLLFFLFLTFCFFFLKLFFDLKIIFVKQTKLEHHFLSRHCMKELMEEKLLLLTKGHLEY